MEKKPLIFLPTCARLGTDELEVNDVTIYPNPVKDLVYINAKDNVNKYEIIDVTGRLIETGQVEKTIKSTVFLQIV